MPNQGPTGAAWPVEPLRLDGAGRGKRRFGRGALAVVMVSLLASHGAGAAGDGGTAGGNAATSAANAAPSGDQDQRALLTRDFDKLWTDLDVEGSLAIMRTEGLMMADDIAEDYLPQPQGDGWALTVSRIYDVDKMATVMREALKQDLAGADISPMIAFFSDTLGRQIVALESQARRTFLDPEAEDAARARIRDGDIDEARVDLIDRFIAVNDLVEFNTSGSMNTNYHFYLGLSQSELFEMSEQEILAQVWGQAEDNRIDTEEWLRAYLSLAYGGLSDAEMQRYIDFSATTAGQRLNRALFAGFSVMYDQQYHALGLAVATQLSGQEL